MSKKTEKEPSNRDILKAINGFADAIEQRFATKDDLHALATKKDLAAIEQRLTGIEDTMAKHNSKIAIVNDQLVVLEDKLLTRLDRILVNTERLETERVAHVAWLQRHDNLFKKLLPQD